MIASFRDRIGALVWTDLPDDTPRMKRYALHALRIVFALGRDIAEGRPTLWAMGLVYTTLLSLAPLLALSFSVLKGFGVHNQIEPLLLNIFAPLGEKSIELTATIIGFVDNLRVGVLGFVGLALLVWIVISLMQKVEDAFNAIWRVTRRRGLAQRFRDYLSVLLIGPLLVVSALGITASLMSAAVVQQVAEIEPFGTLIVSFGRLIPYLMVVGAFAFIYIFVPNTRVRFVPALIGAVVAGLLWQTLGWGFASLVVGSARYDAIYSGFAVLILALIWLHLGWLVLLLGAGVAFYVQHPDQLRARSESWAGNRARERIALAIMLRVTRAFVEGRAAPHADVLLREQPAPPAEVERILALLEKAGLLAATGEAGDAWLPAHDPSAISVKDCLDAVRLSADEGRSHDDTAEGVLDEIEAAIDRVSRSRSLRDLC